MNTEGHYKLTVCCNTLPSVIPACMGEPRMYLCNKCMSIVDVYDVHATRLTHTKAGQGVWRPITY